MYRYFFKRCIDFVLALCVLLGIWPVLLAIAIGLYFANKGAGIFFYQERIGKGEKPFKIIKFKSMTDERGSDGKLLPDTQRLTRIGKFIRKTSLDELPQFINICKGDMSLIGPRALPTTYQFFFTENERCRHDVRPGISGWAQINGRTSISWGDRLKYDLEYLNNISFIFDCKIIFLTLYKVIKSENVGVEKSGLLSFHEYRVAEWEKAGKHHLAVIALRKRKHLIEQQHRNDV